MTIALALLGFASLHTAIDDWPAWWTWIGIVLFVCGCLLWFRRYLRAGVFTGKPAVVLGPHGLDDRQSGGRFAWDQIERLEFWEMHVRGGTQRFLGLWFTDPDIANRALPLSTRVLSFLDQIVVPDEAPYNIPVARLATTTEETAGLIRRYYTGPIDGVGSRIDTTPKRPSRARRFGGWAIQWAIALALGSAVLALLIWLS